MINIKNKLHLGEFISFLLFIILFFGVSFIISTVVGIGFLSFLGFEHDSFKSVIIFFIFYYCIGKPIDFLCISFLDIMKYVNKLPNKVYKFLEFTFQVSITFITINIIDLFMKSITISSLTEILFALLSYAFAQCNDFMNKNK